MHNAIAHHVMNNDQSSLRSDQPSSPGLYIEHDIIW